MEPASLPDAFKVKTENAGSLAESQVFKNGQVTIQDIAAQAVGYIAGPRPGQFVIDMCAAPGGKSTHLASIMNDEGTVLSWDIYDHKISKIEENAQRMNLKSIKASLKDALELDESLIEKADIVLLDAPCSGLGIIRRKPEIKFNKIEDDIYELAEIQSDMLDMASKYIKPGGHLVYSTCTIEPEENELQIKRFIERHPDFKVENIDLDILPELWTHDTKDI